MVARGVINQDCVVPLDFLKGLAEKRFLLFPRSKKAQQQRVAKDKKILQRSRDRQPPFIVEETYFEMSQRILKMGKTQDWLKENGLTEDKIQWLGEQSGKDDILMKTTGDGDNFTFWVATSEIVSTHYLFFAVLGSVMIFLSPYFWKFVGILMSLMNRLPFTSLISAS